MFIELKTCDYDGKNITTQKFNCNQIISYHTGPAGVFVQLAGVNMPWRVAHTESEIEELINNAIIYHQEQQAERLYERFRHIIGTKCTSLDRR